MDITIPSLQIAPPEFFEETTESGIDSRGIYHPIQYQALMAVHSLSLKINSRR